jgi:NAD+ kinase
VSLLVEGLRGVADILVEPELAMQIGFPGTPIEDMDVDFIVSAGGDGTILRTIHRMSDPRPILGINMGTVGFLVDVEPSDAMQALEHIMKGFEVDERSRLAVFLCDQELSSATNEVVLLSAAPAKMLDFEITVDGVLLERLRADGMIFATSTGSTAYAMSAGGPIVDPRVDATVIVPVAPFKLSARPWVIPGKSVIRVCLKLPGKGAFLVVDGQTMMTVSSQQTITMTRAKTPARFVKASKDGFYEKVLSKLA